MMGNKWVQASLLLGVAVGVWFGGWISMYSPIANFIVPFPIGLIAMWIGANARGTNGWGKK